MVSFKQVAIAAAAALAAAAASATPVSIQNPFVLAGVSDYGTLGSNGNVSPGILFDPTGTGQYGVNDFLTPGTPFEGFYLNSSAGFAGANNFPHVNDFTSSSPVAVSGSSATWTGASVSGAYGITNTYTLTTIHERSEISIHTVITNTSGGDISGLTFLRTLDPDPDVNAFGSYETVNGIVDDSTACATGSRSGQTICITTADNAFVHKAGIGDTSPGPYWSNDASRFLGGMNAGNGDYSIGLAFDIGTLAKGGSVSLDYSYAAGKSITSAIPEPTDVAMLLAGLGLVGFAARRRRRA